MIYFSLKEFLHSDTALNNKIENYPEIEEVENIREFVDTVLDPMREDYGKPINISSGFRSEELNAKVKGASESGHRYGWCADLQVKGNIREFADWVNNWLTSHNIKYDELLFEKSGKTEWLHFAWKGKGGRQRMKKFDIIK